MIKLLLTLILFEIAYFECIAKTLEQMQELHKEIGSELMGLRKEFTAAQPKIYSLLDRVDRMYDLAKLAVESKNILKFNLQNKNNEIKKLQSELTLLKNRLVSTEKELGQSSKRLTDLNKDLEIERVQTAILSREKKDLIQEKGELHAQVTGLKFDIDKVKNKKKDTDGDTENLLKSLTDEEKNILKKSQNLTLSSTSAPNSPR